MEKGVQNSETGISEILNAGMKIIITEELIKIIKMDLKETGREDVDWIHPAQCRVQLRFLMIRVMNLRAS